jgi:thiamine-phosphate pyrophosphorylase
MKLIVISHPGGAPGGTPGGTSALPDEAGIINKLFENGLQILHLRKPESTRGQVKMLLSEIDQKYHYRISLHQYHSLAEEFGISRLHFTKKERASTSSEEFQAMRKKGITLSTSIHQIEQHDTLPTFFSYAFFGPVFDSISKKGYHGVVNGGFKLTKKPVSLIALGGISTSNLENIQAMNFDGAAILGALWEQPENAVLNFCRLRDSLIPGASSVAKLQFISNQTTGISHLRSIRMALEGGCKWIQLRVKDQAQEDVLPLAMKAKKLCDGYNAKLIINDFPFIAKQIRAYGLHLGLSDMSIPQARKIVGSEMIIGGTANTFEDIVLRINEGADYVGLGPYRFTTTKQNLSPILGLEGYQKLMDGLAKAGHIIPIIAIGGIGPDDIAALKTTGVHGVAMSSALLKSTDIQETVSKIKSTLC